MTIETLEYQARHMAGNRPCWQRPCTMEFPALPSRWCSACIVRELLEQREKLLAAAEFTFAFLDSIEWNDHTSETGAANALHVLQEAITLSEQAMDQPDTRSAVDPIAMSQAPTSTREKESH